MAFSRSGSNLDSVRSLGDELPPGLREEYLQGVRDRLGEIAELAERLVAAGDDAEAMDQLRREAHRIRGSAGSFGFMNATEVAADLEETVKGWITHPAEGAAQRGAAARAFVRRLAAAFFTRAQAARTPAGQAADAATPSSEDAPEVVVVEDDQALSELLTFGLEARGYRFVLYRNGREALEGLRSLPTGGTPPLLLLDVDLPALDGYSIFETLQRECPGKYRVVFTTVHGGEEEQLRGLEGGALDYLVKPISLRVALEKIRRWVGR